MRIISGLDRPTSGEMYRTGERFAPASPREAVERGVTLVQQHFALVPTMTAVENLLLFRAQRHRSRSRASASADLQALAERLDFEIDPTAPVASMSVGRAPAARTAARPRCRSRGPPARRADGGAHGCRSGSIARRHAPSRRGRASSGAHHPPSARGGRGSRPRCGVAQRDRREFGGAGRRPHPRRPRPRDGGGGVAGRRAHEHQEWPARRRHRRSAGWPPGRRAPCHQRRRGARRGRCRRQRPGRARVGAHRPRRPGTGHDRGQRRRT